MVDGNNGHSRVSLSNVNFHSRFREGGVDRRVDGNRVVRVGRAVTEVIRHRAGIRMW